MVDWNKKIVVKVKSNPDNDFITYPARVLCTDRLSSNRNENCVVAVRIGSDYEVVQLFKNDGTEYGLVSMSYCSYVENDCDG